MTVLRPTSIDEAVAALAAEPAATVLAGGTDLMVAINEGHIRPAEVVIGLDRIAALSTWRSDPPAATKDGRGRIEVGAAITFTELLRTPIAEALPALADAARTVGSPQIRNAGTIGGNLATGSPAGDSLPVLSVADADVIIRSVDGERSVPVEQFMIGVKHTALRPGELITRVSIPTPRGWEGFAKVGVRNAMVIAVANAAVRFDEVERTIAVALGSVGPTVVRCSDAERFLAERFDWETHRAEPVDLEEFAARVSSAAAPITDHRSTARYRRHAVGVLARRLVERAQAGDVAA